MPEGPEIRRAADRVASAVAGRIAEDVFFASPKLKRFERLLGGRKVVSVSPRGKAILTRFEGGRVVYSHNQLYGKWLVARRGELPTTRRSLRFAIHTRERSALLYSASDIEVLQERDLGRHPYLRRLGPDVLDPSVSARTVLERLSSPTFARRSLGALLLDQGFLAGLGNYLRSEVLFDASLHPSARPADLSAEALRALGRSVLRLARRSYRTGGVTNAPGRVKELKAGGARREDYRFAAFARAGLDCYRCGAPIEKLDVSGRRLYLCPRCQSDAR